MSLPRTPIVALLPLLFALLSMPGCAGDGPDAPLASTTTTNTTGGASLLTQIQQDIFTPMCAVSGCHDPLTQEGDLNLANEDTSFDELVNVVSTCAGQMRVVPGDTDASYLLDKVGDGATPCGELMPLDSPSLTAAEIQLIRDWILDGAPPANTVAAVAAPSSSTTSVPPPSTSTTTLP